MDSRTFRAAGHRFVDWMADYLDSVEGSPVRAPGKPGDVLALLPEAAPAAGEPIEALFEDFKSIILPGMTHWQHPSFFAYFPANGSPPSVLAEMLTATLGAQCMSWQTSPAATELEVRMMAWLRDMIGLPAAFEGVIQDSASTANLCAILSARERATGYKSNEAGLAGGPVLTVYGSAECHSSIEKDVRIAGLGAANLRKIPVDSAHAMRADALRTAIEADIAAGCVPICVVAALGSTGSGAIDPLAAIAEICRRHRIWLHVDAAWAGSALILPEHRRMLEGIEAADSFVFNPHKWLFTNFDCSAYFIRDRDALLRTLSILPEYLRTANDGAMPDFRDWGVPLGRRFRALKLWFVIRSYGIEGLQARLRAHIALAEELERWIADDPDFELLAPRSLALLCLRYHPVRVDDPAVLDALNEALVARINESGRAYITHTRLGGVYAIRVSIGQTDTRREHVAALWQQLRSEASCLAQE